MALIPQTARTCLLIAKIALMQGFRDRGTWILMYLLRYHNLPLRCEKKYVGLSNYKKYVIGKNTLLTYLPIYI